MARLTNKERKEEAQQQPVGVERADDVSVESGRIVASFTRPRPSLTANDAYFSSHFAGAHAICLAQETVVSNFRPLLLCPLRPSCVGS